MVCFCKNAVRKSACEGHGGSEGFITHEGTRITDPKGTYKLGEAWKCSDQVWAYWTADATTASLGTVMAVGTMTLRFHQLIFSARFPHTISMNMTGFWNSIEQ